MSTRQARTICRICVANCGVVLTIDDAQNKIIGIKGDKENPMSNGYVCFKGLQLDELHHAPARLLRPKKRLPDGSYQEIGVEQALDEIAEKLRMILNRDGPEAIATFMGTQGSLVSTNLQFPFLQAIGSTQFYSTHTIDQSAKSVSFERQGGWGAGLQELEQSEVVLFFGANPVISHSVLPVICNDPLRTLKHAKERGLKLICIDPRRSETAELADIFLQPVPGRDAVIAAALIRLILQEGWEDKEFFARHVGEQNLAQLRLAVAPFTPEMAEHCAGLAPGQIREVAKLFARDCKSGAAFAGTGPCMGAFSNLAQHLVDTLNIICGRFRRAGDKAAADMISPQAVLYAEVIPPPRSYAAFPENRFRGAGRLGIDRLSGTLADEILTPGPGQIRAMLVTGGNPASNLPDEKKIVDALRDLELLVVMDPFDSPTAQLAHYVLPPRMMFERTDLSFSIGLTFPGMAIYPKNWALLAQAPLQPPAGSELVDDWYVYWSLAKRLGLQLVFNNIPLDMETAPALEDILAARLANASLSLQQLQRDQQEFPGGKIYDAHWSIVQPARPGADAKFEVMPPDVAAELAALRASPQAHSIAPAPGFTHLMASRRMNQVMNTLGNTLPRTLKRTPYNPAFLNPDEMHSLGLVPGEEIALESAHGRITAIAQPDKALRPGVVSIAHCWGGLPGQAGPGVNVNALLSNDMDTQPINAMPLMSAVPVNIRKSRAAQAAAE